MNFPVQTTTGSEAIEGSRAVTEAQGAIIVAKKFPRDENTAFTKVMTACKRISLANTAIYSYKKGGIVTGPSIRLAEVLARSWGNMTYGFREISRNETGSEIEAFCWDMESNVRVARTFTVKHWRDIKNGNGYALKSERDKYELVANMAQRRVRACILEIIPGDVVEAAVEQCNRTIREGDGSPLEDRVRKMVVTFKDMGISQANIVEYLGYNIDAMIPTDFVKLQGVYKAIKDGVSTREDFFTIKKKSSANDAIPNKAPEKKQKPTTNPLHETPEGIQWMKDSELFPELSAGMQEPTTPEQCVEACKQLSKMVSERDAQK